MRVTCENVHIRNLANFDTLIAKIIGYGKYYRPAKSSIQLEALGIVSQNAKVAIATVHLLTDQCKRSFKLREEAFESLTILNQKIYKAFQSATNSSETEMYMLVGTSKASSNDSASQQHYDFLADNFCKIIKLLKTNPLFLSQKTELKIQRLEDFYAILSQKNSELKQNYNLLNYAHVVCNEVFYREHYGLLALANTAKMYIKYRYGWDSEEFKHVAGLLIKKAK